MVKSKGTKNTVMGADLTSGGSHTVQYTDCISQNYTLETCLILLTNIAPINVI